MTAAFVVWELRTPAAPMLPMRFFRDRAFAAANGASLLMYFGMFGSIFLLAQFLQTVQGRSAPGNGRRRHRRQPAEPDRLQREPAGHTPSW